MLKSLYIPNDYRYSHYSLEFKDSMGWYCPGMPWSNASHELIIAWKPELKLYGDKVRLIGHLKDKAEKFNILTIPDTWD